MVLQPDVEIQDQFAYCKCWSVFLANRKGQFQIWYLEVIAQKKVRDGTVKLKMSQ